MADIMSPAARSERMSRIRGQDTAPELALRRSLHAAGLRYRLHVPGMPGKPDLVFPRWRTVVFVHGCFWHQHQPCKIAKVPRSNTAFWLTKFEANKRRDARVARALRALGWRVLVVRECQLSTARKLGATCARVEQFLRVDRA